MATKIDRRTFLKLAGIGGGSIVAGNVLSACQPTPTPTAAAAATAPAAAATAPAAAAATAVPTTLPYAGETIHLLSHPVFEALYPPFSKFKELTGIDLVYEGVPFPGITDKTALELASGSSAYDVMTLADQWINLDMLTTVQPQDELLAASPVEDPEGVPRGLIEMNTINGKMWGWENRTGAFILVYRKDLYEQKGLSIPKSFTQLRENAVALNDPPNMYGFFIQGSPDGWACDDWVNTLFNFGGSILSDDYKVCVLDSPQAMAATKFWLEWAEQKLVPPGSATQDYSDQITSMQQGLVAQAITYSPYVVPIEDPAASKTKGMWGYAVVPVAEDSGLSHSSTHMSGWTCVIPKGSKHHGAAWEWIKWHTNPENDLYMAMRGNGPVRSSTFASAEYQAVNPAGPIISEALAYGRAPLPPVKKKSEIGLAIAAELSACVAGQKNYSDVLLGLKEKIDGML